MHVKNGHKIPRKLIKIVCTVIVHPNGKVLLVRRPTTEETRPGYWECPGGHIDEGEDLETAAIREAQEEVGVQVVLSGDREYFELDDDPGQYGVMIKATPVQHVIKPNLKEHDRYVWVDKEELLKYQPAPKDFAQTVEKIMEKSKRHATLVVQEMRRRRAKRELAEETAKDLAGVFNLESPAWEAVFHVSTLKSPDLENFAVEDNPSPMHKMLDVQCKPGKKDDLENTFHLTVRDVLEQADLWDRSTCTTSRDEIFLTPDSEDAAYKLVASLRKAGFLPQVCKSGLVVVGPYNVRQPNAFSRRAVVEKSGDKWLVKTKDRSRTLGKHDTKEKALAQLKAIETNKHASADRSARYEKVLADMGAQDKGHAWAALPVKGFPGRGYVNVLVRGPVTVVIRATGLNKLKTKWSGGLNEAFEDTKDKFGLTITPSGHSGDWIVRGNLKNLKTALEHSLSKEPTGKLKQKGYDSFNKSGIGLVSPKSQDAKPMASGRKALIPTIPTAPTVAPTTDQNGKPITRLTVQEKPPQDPAKQLQQSLSSTDKVKMDPSNKDQIVVETTNPADTMKKLQTAIDQKNLPYQMKASARRAKQELLEIYGRASWLRGVVAHGYDQGKLRLVMVVNKEAKRLACVCGGSHKGTPVGLVTIVSRPEGSEMSGDPIDLQAVVELLFNHLVKPKVKFNEAPKDLLPQEDDVKACGAMPMAGRKVKPAQARPFSVKAPGKQS